jgi:uncharacterized protein YkwD
MRNLHVFSLAAATLLTGCVVVAPPIESPVDPPPSTRDEVRAFTELVNKHRRQIGCKELTWVSAVASIAQKHSEDMYHNNFFSHTNHFGKTPFDRLREAGIAYTAAAENIAEGQRTAEQVLASWLSSSGHRRNIEDCRMLQHGVGLANNHWTHMFVRLRQ